MRAGPPHQRRSDEECKTAEGGWLGDGAFGCHGKDCSTSGHAGIIRIGIRAGSAAGIGEVESSAVGSGKRAGDGEGGVVATEGIKGIDETERTAVEVRIPGDAGQGHKMGAAVHAVPVEFDFDVLLVLQLFENELPGDISGPGLALDIDLFVQGLGIDVLRFASQELRAGYAIGRDSRMRVVTEAHVASELIDCAGSCWLQQPGDAQLILQIDK